MAGLVAGLAWWTNLIHTIPIVVTAGVILLRWPRLRPAALALPLAFVAGSAPVWLFGAVHGHLGAVRTPLAEPAAMVGHARLLLTNALPLLVGWPPSALAGPAGPWLAAGSLIVLAAATAACIRAGPGGWLVAGVVGLSSTVVVLAEHGKYLGLAEPLYLIPVVAVLPVAVGVLLAQLASWRRLAALALTVGSPDRARGGARREVPVGLLAAALGGPARGERLHARHRGPARGGRAHRRVHP